MKIPYLLNMKINFLILALVALLTTSSYANQENETNVQIKGQITNLKKANDYLFGNSYIYLVHENEKIEFGIHASGAMMMLPADGRAQKIPESGDFVFKSTNMKPGQYYLFVQPVKRFTMKIAGQDLGCTIITRENDSTRPEIMVPEKTTGKSTTIDLGNVWIKLP
jgi:hypothetical protein